MVKSAAMHPENPEEVGDYPFDVTAPIRFASQEHVFINRGLFSKQGEFLNQIDLSTAPERVRGCWPLLQAIIRDVEAITILTTKARFGGQTLMIYRGLLEAVTTFLYLQVATDDEFRDFAEYSKQKTYRIMQWGITVDYDDGPVTFKMVNNIKLDEHPDLKAAVDKFTSASGKPKTRWSNTSVATKSAAVKKAHIVDTKPLEFLLSYLYDDGSEALHATFYGCLSYVGVYSPSFTVTEESITSHYSSYIVTAFWLGLSMLKELNKYLLSFGGQDELKEKVVQGADLADEWMKRALDKNSSVDGTVPNQKSAIKPQD